jgi:hypothetical protein
MAIKEVATTFDEAHNENIKIFMNNVLEHAEHLTVAFGIYDVTNPSSYTKLLTDVVLWSLPKIQLQLPENFPYTAVFKRAYQVGSFHWVRGLLEKVTLEKTILELIFKHISNQHALFNEILKYVLIERNMGEIIVKEAREMGKNDIADAAKALLNEQHLTESHEQQREIHLEHIKTISGLDDVIKLNGRALPQEGWSVGFFSAQNLETVTHQASTQRPNSQSQASLESGKENSTNLYIFRIR